MKFRDKKVFLTGATRGIGKAIAEGFRREGAHIIGTSTRQLDDFPDICNDYLVADFKNDEDINYCSEFIRDYQPDILINNAGINKIQPFLEIDKLNFLEIQKINTFAPFIFCQSAIPSMKLKNWGRIINISSIWGRKSKSGRASYSASKFALDGLTLALAIEYSQYGILANCIAPGFTDTELTRNSLKDSELKEIVRDIPIRRMADVKEIANFVLWLSSEENSYITGQNIPIDGGFLSG